MPQDFMRYTIGVRDEEIHNFILAPNICFDYYPIKTPAQIEFEPELITEAP